jgi:VWFA-related protein
MRKLGVLLLLAAMALPAFGARRVTVEQLQQLLLTAGGKPDEEVARQLTGLELSERATTARLAQWKAELPGPKAQQALVALVDESAFLDLPAAELPALATPDFATQRRIMSAAVEYVGKTIPKLPNFFATRSTSSYEDTPQEHGLGRIEFTGYQPMHSVGNSAATVLYRDGKEIVDAGAATGKKAEPEAQGLTTWGVFGPILGTVLVDAAKSTLAWSHWEQTSAGPLAVFRYAVPREKSNYEVKFAVGRYVLRKLTGYHGELAIDPASGAILRLTVEADTKTADAIDKADILVEYGPVEIGGKTYICPLKSVSISQAPVIHAALGYYFSGTFPGTRQTLLNDVAFGQYHLFRAEARILTGNGPEEAENSPAVPGEASAAETPSAQQDASLPATSAGPIRTGAAADGASPARESAAAAPAPMPPAEAPEISVAEASGLPESALATDTGVPQTGFVLRTTARLVDVGVVVRDKKGHPVTGLKREDFEILDDGDRQQIQFFTPPGGGSVAEPASPPGQQGKLTEPAGSTPAQPTFSNRREPGAGQGSDGNVTILLIDGSNLAFADLSRARGEILRFLGSLPAGERVGLYAMRMQGYEVLLEPTGDRAQLEARLTQWTPSAQDQARAQSEERRNRQQFDTVHSAEDLAYVNGNNSEAPDSAASVDPELRDFGSNPGREALRILVGVARHLAAIPGHKNLVWVTSDNVLADWTDRAVSIEKGSKFIEKSALQAQEAMNEAHTSVYPLDASSLEGGGIEAGIKNRNVEVSPVSGSTPRNMQPGRATAAMQQDLHAIQGPMREVAEATGGRALRRAGDLAAELNGVVEDGQATYQLSFTPDVPADDHYHRLTVKLAAPRDLTLRYRTGYLYQREAGTLKERFHEAVWQPEDASEIALSADLAAASKGATLKLNIPANDLALAQQDDLWTDKLDVFLVERNDASQQAKVTGQTLGLRLKPATCQKMLREGIPFDQLVEATPQSGSVRIIVVDENSGRMGSVTVPAAAFAAKH